MVSRDELLLFDEPALALSWYSCDLIQSSFGRTAPTWARYWAWSRRTFSALMPTVSLILRAFSKQSRSVTAGTASDRDGSGGSGSLPADALIKRIRQTDFVRFMNLFNRPVA